MSIKNKKLLLTAFTSFTLVLFVVPYFLTRTNIQKAILAVSYWPLSPAKHLQLAKLYFNNNYLNKAKEEYILAKNLAKKVGAYKITKNAQKQFREVETLFKKQQKLNQQKKYYQDLNSRYPNSPQILLNLSLVYYQLSEDANALKTWQKAFYLSPNNTQVLEVKKILAD